MACVFTFGIFCSSDKGVILLLHPSCTVQDIIIQIQNLVKIQNYDQHFKYIFLNND